MKKVFIVLGIMLIGIICYGQKSSIADIYKKIPKEIINLFPKDHSMIKIDANVKAVFEKHKATLQSLEYESYLLALNQKGPGGASCDPFAPFFYRIICWNDQCGYSEPCPINGCCTWQFGCQSCCYGQRCPSCGEILCHHIEDYCWIGMCWPW